MFKLALTYLHLIAVCLALGSILATDLRLIVRVRDADFRLAPPNRFIVQLVTGSLVLLYISGAALVAIGLGERADYLSNPKLQGKLLLVAALTLNAVALHVHTFPWLRRGQRLSASSLHALFGIALPIAVSNALWLYVAFLGIARPWNFAVPLSYVIAVAAVSMVATWAGVIVVVMCAARAQRVRHATVRRRAHTLKRFRPTLAREANSPLCKPTDGRVHRADDRISETMAE